VKALLTELTEELPTLEMLLTDVFTTLLIGVKATLCINGIVGKLLVKLEMFIDEIGCNSGLLAIEEAEEAIEGNKLEGLGIVAVRLVVSFTTLLTLFETVLETGCNKVLLIVSNTLLKALLLVLIILVTGILDTFC
jgi:hypothetical protein